MPPSAQVDELMNDDPAAETEDADVRRHKIVNEEYKIWKKNAPFLYDVMLSRALDWPTLTTQWFPDKQTPPGENYSVHRLLIGTHTQEDKQNYLQIVHIQIPELKPDPEDYNAETEEIGGYGAGKKATVEMKFDIVQRIDHDGEVNKARYMPQNPNIIATMGPNGSVNVFDRTKHSSQPDGTVNPQIKLIGHKEEGFALNWNPFIEGQLITGSLDSTVNLWNIKDFSKENKNLKPTRTFRHHTSAVNDVEVHSKFDWMIATVSDDKSLQILDTRQDNNSTAASCVDEAHTDAVNCVAFNHGTEYLIATGSADRTIALWDLRKLKDKLHVCDHHTDSVVNLEWHPFEKHVLASSSYDRRVNFWDLSRCGEEQTPEDAEDGPPELLFMHGGHTDRIADFSWNKNDPWLICSAAEDNMIQIWKASKKITHRDDRDIPLEEVEN